MAQFGSDCAIDENVNNRLRIQTAPVRHSAGDIDDVSTQSYRHSAVRHRHRRTPDSDISNSTGLSTSELRSVGDLSPRFTDSICDWKVSSNGTPSPRVDTSDRARHQMTHTNGCRDTERRQTSSIDVKNADCNAVLAQTKDTPVRLLSDSNKNIGTSDGSAHDKSTRTLPSTLSNGAACVSNSVNAGSFPLLAINDVPVFDYSNPDSSRKDSARNSKILRRRSAIEYRKPNTSVSETSLNGFPAIEYTKSDGGTSAIGDARNEKKLVLRSESESALAKAGDFDREREIERRMRELGLWEYKREQERHLVEILDAQITQRDGLSAALHRCRRRQRGPSASAADDIRCQVNHHFVRNAWGKKVAYEVQILMGCFTRDVAYMTADNVVTVRGVTSDPGITLTKEMTIELPSGVDSDDVTVTYTAGVVRIRAPISRLRRNLARSATRSLGSSGHSSNSLSP